MKSFCDYFNQNLCNSCSWIPLQEEEQIQRKETKAKTLLQFHLEPTQRSPQKKFRKKIKMSVTGTLENPRFGITGKQILDEGQDLSACPIHEPKLNALLQALPQYVRTFNLSPYQIATQKGELKGLIAFYSDSHQEMYLRFILRSKECISRIQKLIPDLQAQFPELKCISANIQPIPHAILEGKEEIILTNTPYIHYQVGSTTLSLAPEAFVQTNTEVALHLYQTAALWIKEAEQAQSIHMLELFSGQGAFSFAASREASKILGIEINPKAVKTAKETAAQHQLNNIDFQCFDLNKATDQVIQIFNPNLILANPPRRGLGESVQLIEKTLPEHFFYSSCAIESLAQDLERLTRYYQIHRAKIFDLFPHTEHFETLIWLTRRREPESSTLNINNHS